MAKMTEKIVRLEYRAWSNKFYDVIATTDDNKIAIEGNVCAGILKQLIEATRKDGGVVVKHNKHNSESEKPLSYNLSQPYKDLEFANNNIKSINKKLDKIKRIINSINL